MSQLGERVAAQSAMQKLVSYRGTPDLRELPFGMVKPSRTALHWLRGVRGELEMSRELGALGDGWMVLHSIPVSRKGHDIDHLVVGPSGVFPINSKRLIDKRVRVVNQIFMVDEYDRDYLEKSYREATLVENVLKKSGVSAPIVPIIAISGAKRLRVKRPMWKDRHIGVVRMQKVARRISQRRSVLSLDQTYRIADALLEPDRWSRVPTVDVADLVASYESIDRGVGRWRAAVISSAFLIVAAATAVVAVWEGFWFGMVR